MDQRYEVGPRKERINKSPSNSVFIFGNSASFFIQGDIFFVLRYVFNMGIFLSVPLLYLYLLGRYDNKNALKKTDILHFIPFLLAFSFMIFRVIYAKNQIHQFETYGIVFICVLFIQNIVYLIIIYSKLKDLSKRTKKSFRRNVFSKMVGST